MQSHGKPRTGNADGEADGGDQAGFMYVFFDEVAQKRRAHTEEEDRERERPTERACADSVAYERFLDRRAEKRPTVHRANPAMQKKRGNRRASPFVT